QEAAQLALEQELPRIREHAAPGLADRALTLGAFLDTWLKRAKTKDGKPWRPSTCATYKGAVEGYLRPMLGHIHLLTLVPEQIDAMPAGLESRGLSRRSVHQVNATLRAALNAAIRARKITWNPCAAAPVAGPGKPRIEVWTAPQVAGFLRHAYERMPDLAVA